MKEAESSPFELQHLTSYSQCKLESLWEAPSLDQLFVLVSATVKPDFFGTAWTGLTPWLLKMEKMIPLSGSFRISARTTSYIIGFNLRCRSLLGVASSLR